MEPGHLGAESGSTRRARPLEGWRALAAPWLLITVSGAVLIGYLSCCAHKTGLEAQLTLTQQRLDQQRTYREDWNALINKQKDPTQLRAWADTRGMVYAPAHVDHVQLSQALPPVTDKDSPLAPLQPPPSKQPRAPADALARAPVRSSQD